MRLTNEHDLEGASGLVTDDFVIVFGHDSMNWSDYSSEVQKICFSFPDFRFPYRSIEVKTDGGVIVHGLTPMGTHTAKPYAFRNGVAIEARGTAVQNGPEDLHFFFGADGKICREEVVNAGPLAGPPGIYKQLGGFLAWTSRFSFSKFFSKIA